MKMKTKSINDKFPINLPINVRGNNQHAVAGKKTCEDKHMALFSI